MNSVYLDTLGARKPSHGVGTPRGDPISIIEAIGICRANCSVTSSEPVIWEPLCLRLLEIRID